MPYLDVSGHNFLWQIYLTSVSRFCPYFLGTGAVAALVSLSTFCNASAVQTFSLTSIQHITQ